MDDSVQATVAIDFGTTNSGAAYSLARDRNKDICTLEFPGSPNVKVPTSVVLERKPPHNAVGFGPEAIEEFDEDEHAIFHRFKMQLYDKPDARGLKADVGDCWLQTETVIARCLQLLRDRVLRQIKEKHALDLKAKQVRWVLTVPAIWKEAAKATMRRAARQGGLIRNETSNRLVLALEPECAALDCHESLDKSLLKAGTRYLVVDCGGGTLDTAAFEVQRGKPDLQLHAALPPRGGHWGSTCIDAKFLEFVRELLGNPACMRGNTFAVFDLLTSVWEDRKVNFGIGVLRKPDARVAINLNPVLQAMDNPPRLCDAVQRYMARHPGVQLKALGSSQLRIPASFMNAFYHDVLSGIGTHVCLLLDEMERVDYVVLVGGFGCCSFVQDVVRNQAEAAGAKFLTPSKPWASIVVGAVRFGISPRPITSRRASSTYGTAASMSLSRFRAKHGPVDVGHRKFWHEEKKEAYVRNVFSAFVNAHDEVSVGQRVQHTYLPLKTHSSSVSFAILTSPQPDVVFSDEPNVQQLATLTVNVEEGRRTADNPIETQITFGGTELEIFVKSKTTGLSERARLDFRLN